MPKETFLQINPEKRERVLAAAAAVFAELGFHRADIARIAERAAISKGSIYNYFETKDDMYLHVCRDGLARFRKAVYSGLEPEWDFYRQVDHVFERGARFAVGHPEYIRLYLNIESAGMDRFAEALTLEVESYFASYFKSLIVESQRRGTVRGELDPDLTALLISSLFRTFILSPVSSHYRARIQIYLSDRIDDEGESGGMIGRVTDMIRKILQPGSKVS